MILDAIINSILGLLYFIVEILPNASIDVINSLNANFASFRSYLGIAGWIFPSNVFLTVLALILTVEGIFLLWKVFLKVMSAVTFGAMR